MSSSDTPHEDETRASAMPSAETLQGFGKLCVLVLGENVVATHPIPDHGEVTLGRSAKADVLIDDPSISRAHARLTVGPQLTIEDLGSSNGTRVRDRRLAEHERAPITPGEVVVLGNVTIVVQRRSTPLRPRRTWAHDYFEARLEEECARAVRSGASFALVRLAGAPSTQPEAVHETLATVLRSSDVIGEYGPREWELLLMDGSVADVEQVVTRLREELARRGGKVRAGVAWFPQDGRSPDALAARAGAAARGLEPPVAATPERVVIVDRTMQELHRVVERVAAGHITVLILGETGVGKEILAERVHALSPRAKKPFLRLNCASLSETLLESELFGHERGAFTSAVSAKAGLLETADGGTVFLDEVGELPLTFQVKLLRVLETRQVQRVGGLRPRALDVRFVAATNRDLEAEILRGTFRQDLFFRLNGATIVVPPLRERSAEIVELARMFLLEASSQAGLASPPPLDSGALDALLRYSWPGNIRELRNVIERAVLLCAGGPITEAHLPVEKMRGSSPPPLARATAGAALPLVAAAPLRPTGSAALPARPGGPAPPPPPLSEDETDPGAGERERILAALAQCAGNQTHAAVILGISRRTLINRIEQYGIARPRKRKGGAEDGGE